MPVWIAVIILAVVEGITEFIPVSSTGHLLLAELWLPRQTDLFNIVIQCGAVLAVLPLFHERLHQFLFRWRERETQQYMFKILVAFAITGAIGFVLDKKGLKLPDEPRPVVIALFVGGALFVLVEKWLHGRGLGEQVTWPIVIAVAIGQLLAAVFPGTSRSGATILFALLLGLNRVKATEFSFLVGIPTMLAAGGLKIFKSLHHRAVDAPAENWNMVLLATVIAAVVSFVAVKWLLRYVQTHTFTAFGWYRMGMAALIALLLAISQARPRTSTHSSTYAPADRAVPYILR